MSYNIKNALADFKKEDLADGMIDILKDSTRTLEKTKENGFLKLSLKCREQAFTMEQYGLMKKMVSL